MKMKDVKMTKAKADLWTKSPNQFWSEHYEKFPDFEAALPNPQRLALKVVFRN